MAATADEGFDPGNDEGANNWPDGFRVKPREEFVAETVLDKSI